MECLWEYRLFQDPHWGQREQNGSPHPTEVKLGMETVFFRNLAVNRNRAQRGRMMGGGGSKKDFLKTMWNIRLYAARERTMTQKRKGTMHGKGGVGIWALGFRKEERRPDPLLQQEGVRPDWTQTLEGLETLWWEDEGPVTMPDVQ